MSFSINNLVISSVISNVLLSNAFLIPFLNVLRLHNSKSCLIIIKSFKPVAYSNGVLLFLFITLTSAPNLISSCMMLILLSSTDKCIK